MSKQVRLRRGTTAQHATFTGADGEITFDTDKKCLVAHDGITAGGRAVTGWVQLTPALSGEMQVIASGLHLTGGEDSYGLRVSQVSMFDGEVQLNGPIVCNGSLTFAQVRPAVEVLTYAATVELVPGYGRKKLTLAGNVTFSVSAYYPDVQMRVIIYGDGSTRNVSFPSGWRFVGGTRPATLAGNKVAVLDLEWLGSAESDVVARWSVEC
jgi:hypothetical protein